MALQPKKTEALLRHSNDHVCPRRHDTDLAMTIESDLVREMSYDKLLSKLLSC